MSDVRTRLHFNRNEGSVTAERIQDVEPILDNNAALRSERQKSDWGRHVASIPNVIIEKWLTEEYNRGNTTLKFPSPEFDALVKRKLADPDWKWLRTDK